MNSTHQLLRLEHQAEIDETPLNYTVTLELEVSKIHFPLLEMFFKDIFKRGVFFTKRICAIYVKRNNSVPKIIDDPLSGWGVV